jgi:hypothetical protein
MFIIWLQTCEHPLSVIFTFKWLYVFYVLSTLKTALLKSWLLLKCQICTTIFVHSPNRTTLWTSMVHPSLLKIETSVIRQSTKKWPAAIVPFLAMQKSLYVAVFSCFSTNHCCNESILMCRVLKTFEPNAVQESRLHSLLDRGQYVFHIL